MLLLGIISMFGLFIIPIMIIENELDTKTPDNYTVLDLISIYLMFSIFLLPTLIFIIVFGIAELIYIAYNKLKPYLEHKPFKRKE